MSDTTAYLAGCATTGVAALVLLVARVGMVSSGAESTSARQVDNRVARIEAATPNPQTLADSQSGRPLQDDIRRELDKQRDLTQKLEEQLVDQKSLSTSLEDQLSEQEEKTRDLGLRIQEYQQSVDDLEINDKIAAAARPTSPVQSGPPASVIWLGAALAFTLVLGGGGLVLCAVLLFMQSQRNRYRGVPMRPPMPMPPASGYHYDQNFLPPAQFRPQRPSYYDYPPPPYDYNQ
ncbi:MAG: hypothetical protein DCF25_08205 [Leptolyngbya foveolarum]|uniref:Heterocyst differentiation related protein n=1 Tax=Leptolyngbya foveolarum TaxID=47253 RepID=A0A2W4UHA1_9CYAN|nr:MAG: hypothetical protein DCF25_08205 [Leptolyngbya foveolarum]